MQTLQKVCQLGCSLFLLVSPLSASELILNWTYPRSLAPESFTIQVNASDQKMSTTMTVAASPPGVCGTSPVDSYCARLGCFPKTTLTFQVKAIWSKKESDFSPSISCEIGKGVCACGEQPVSQIPTAVQPTTISMQPPAEQPFTSPPDEIAQVPQQRPSSILPVNLVIPKPPTPPPYEEGMILPSLSADSILPPFLLP